MNSVTEALPAVSPGTQHTPTPVQSVTVTPDESTAPSRSWLKPLLIVTAVLAALGWGTHFGLHAYHYEDTDNAYLVGHLHQVSPQLGGQVKEVLVQDNQIVQAGDVLARLDPLEFEIAVQKARAALALAEAQQTQTAAAASQADAQLAEAIARVAQAEAQIVQARAQLDLTQLTLGRNEQLFKNGGAVTQADLDNARAAYDAAKATLDAATANRTAAAATIGSAEAARKSAAAQATGAAANIASASAALADAQRQLAYTVITAPAAGRVGNRSVEVGNLVAAGQTLLAIAEPAPWIVANFKETQLNRMRAGQEVDITVDALDGQELHGRIDSLSPASGAQFALLPPDNATGNFNKVVQRVPVKIVLDTASAARLGDRLRLGFSVIVQARVR